MRDDHWIFTENGIYMMIRLLNISLSYLSHKIIKRTKVECAEEPLPISFELIFRIIFNFSGVKMPMENNRGKYYTIDENVKDVHFFTMSWLLMLQILDLHMRMLSEHFINPKGKQPRQVLYYRRECQRCTFLLQCQDY